MGSGKLIVIEGLDGSGKATQTRLLAEALDRRGMPVRQISFPDYENPSSTLVKMYLAGEVGALEAVNSYAASAFYSVDRYVSYQNIWKKDYQSGHTILADRYTTSNAAHQMAKLPEGEWDAYLSWLEDFEYQKIAIPKPDQVLYLDMHPAVSKILLSSRYGGDESKKDIHEANYQYNLLCRRAALYAANRQGWIVIACSDEKAPHSVEEIAQRVLETVIGH